MTSKLPTDPLADASTGVVRRSRGASVKNVPKGKDRRDPSRRKTYTGPERRQAEEPQAPAGEPRFLLGYPRWIVISAGVYLAALVLAMVLIFNY